MSFLEQPITLYLYLFQLITKNPQKIVDVTHFVFLHSQYEGFSSPLLKNAYTCLFNLCYRPLCADLENTRPYAALWAEGLDWIVRLYYSLG